MPMVERISVERSKEWREALAPYERGVEEFAEEKGLNIRRWARNTPRWLIGRTYEPQELDDLDKIWWNIQLGYNEKEKKLRLVVEAWKYTEYDVPEGRVSERRGSDSSEKYLIATWENGAQISIKELLETAYQRANSYTEQDLTAVSADITGEDGFTRAYNLHKPPQQNL